MSERLEWSSRYWIEGSRGDGEMRVTWAPDSKRKKSRPDATRPPPMRRTGRDSSR